MTEKNQFSFKDNHSLRQSTPPAFKSPVRAGSPELDVLIAEIKSDALERRQSGAEAHPFYAIELIKQSRLGALRLPIKLGGGGASLRDLFYVVIRLSEVDSDVAHILRSHYFIVEKFLLNLESDFRNGWLSKVVEGSIIGNAVTEISSQNVGSLKYVYDTILTPDGGGYRLNGTKYFSTGTLYADWVAVIASTPDGSTISAIIPTDREGITLEDDWDGIGQKRTGSGTTRFNNVLVQPDEILKGYDDKIQFKSFSQLYLQAVIAGILRNVVTDASALVHKRSRTFSHGAADTAPADPQLQQIIGEISSSSFVVEAAVLAAAEAQDTAVNSAINGVIDFDLNHDASLRAAQVKVVIEDLAFKAATKIFEVGGASATKQSMNLDRHWRNIRTLASHNPAVYKARAIGNYVVNGTGLPSNSYF